METLSDARLEEIQQRLVELPDEEWGATSRQGDDWDSVVYIPGTYNEVCQCFHERGNEEECEVRTQFIAHSRADIPYLLSQVEALTRQLAELNRCNTELGFSFDAMPEKAVGKIRQLVPPSPKENQ